MRVGIVGCGRMGNERARALRQLGAELVFCCDTDLSRATQLAALHPRARALRTVDGIDWSSINALFVCTPPAMRGPVELTCVRAGVSLFVEKPVGVEAAQCAPIVDALRSQPVINAVGYMHRCRNSVQHVRSLTASRNLLAIACVWIGRMYQVPWWLDEGSSGGPFNEQGTHLIDLCRYWGGDVDTIASVEWRPTMSKVAYGIATSIRLSRGCVATVLYNCQANEKDISVQVFTDQGAVVLRGWDLRLERNTVDGIFPAEEGEEIFVKETRSFLDAVSLRDQSVINCDFAEAYKTQVAVDAARAATQPVR